MQEKEPIIVVRCKLKIPSLDLTVQHDCHPCDVIFSPHLTTIKNSDILSFPLLQYAGILTEAEAVKTNKIIVITLGYSCIWINKIWSLFKL